MTRSEFLSAANKGQGRALIALREGGYRASLHDIRRLVLRWPDDQGEDSRGWYTVELIAASGFIDELSALVTRHLHRKKGERAHRWHRKSVVLELAKRGMAQARQALYDHFDPADEFALAREILDLDGFEGLSWLISHEGVALASENSWTFHWWLEDLQEKLGESAVSEWFARESAGRPEVAEFARIAAIEPSKPWKPPAEDSEVPTYEALRAGWRTSGNERMSIFRWVRLAGPEQLDKAWAAMETEEDAEWLRRLGHALRRKGASPSIDRLVAKALAWSDERNPFAFALEEVVDPRIRQLGFDLIAAGWVADGLSLVITNAQPGDEPFLLSALSRLADADEIHGASGDALRLGPEFDCRELLLWVYNETPYSMCRESAVRRLIERGEAPDGLLQESLFDCVDETRRMARNVLAGRR